MCCSILAYLVYNYRSFRRRLPMARVWPPAHYGISLGNMDLQLPPWDKQDRLIEIYFTYLHPFFPAIHKNRFFTEYQYR